MNILARIGFILAEVSTSDEEKRAQKKCTRSEVFGFMVSDAHPWSSAILFKDVPSLSKMSNEAGGRKKNRLRFVERLRPIEPTREPHRRRSVCLEEISGMGDEHGEAHVVESKGVNFKWQSGSTVGNLGSTRAEKSEFSEY